MEERLRTSSMLLVCKHLLSSLCNRDVHVFLQFKCFWKKPSTQCFGWGSASQPSNDSISQRGVFGEKGQWKPLLCLCTYSQLYLLKKFIALWNTIVLLCCDDRGLPAFCDSSQTIPPWISLQELGWDWRTHLCEVATGWKLSGISLSSSGSGFGAVAAL